MMDARCDGWFDFLFPTACSCSLALPCCAASSGYWAPISKKKVPIAGSGFLSFTRKQFVVGLAFIALTFISKSAI